jgi:predicted O-linked N-acetylglucosamine transferase (SPINDLY family)
VLAERPRHLVALRALGTIASQTLDHATALELLDRVLQENPRDPGALNNRGVALLALRRPEEALASFDHALAANPEFIEALTNRGEALGELRRYADALDSLDRAARLDPGGSGGSFVRGNLLMRMGRHKEALASYERVLERVPDHAEALAHRGAALIALRRRAEAVDSYRAALRIAPDFEFIAGDCLHTQMQICDWQGLDAGMAHLSERIRRGDRASTPFPTLSLCDSPELQRKAAETWVAARHPQRGELPPLAPRTGHDRIRIGYFSADFRDHPISILMAEIFEKHDRSRFEVTGFAFGPVVSDAMAQRVSAAFDRCLDVRGLADKEVAGLARAHEIDIAVDLGGFTANCRTDIFAHRAAPVQVSYLGYLGTMGASYIDYLIVDSTLVPAADRQHYSEKLVYLPSYQANDRKRRISRRHFSRTKLGLPETGFVYCCFNNGFKIAPRTFGAWMRILARVPQSVLWLYADDPVAVANLRREAGLAGVAPERLVFAARLPAADYLARYRAADLFLDTLPYNAGTTASDALWAGLPVLSCLGRTFAGRMAASLLHAAGLPELVMDSAEAYEELAVRLANDPEHLLHLRQELADRRLVSRLFDSDGFVRDLETGFERMHAIQSEGLPPQDIHVAAVRRAFGPSIS